MVENSRVTIVCVLSCAVTHILSPAGNGKFSYYHVNPLLLVSSSHGSSSESKDCRK
jgi:hypothetical protein